ncbi:MAG TPA: hypothetical protein VMU87_21455 [Stellaceae bacterium]|nr:hypothetical protein [Stellaceae bacterium]
MAFKIFPQIAPQDEAERLPMGDDPTLQSASRQLALRLNARPVGVPASKPPPGRTRTHGVQVHIAHLAGQIEALRAQLRDHASDRIALLLREMIAEREHELDRWLAREEAWDRRLDSIEGAIAERDAFRQREADLVRERDAALQAAAAARAQREAAERVAEAARNEAESVRRLAGQATAEQLRLRAEREIDKQAWISERRALAQKLERLQDGGWLSRLVKR